MPEKKAGERRMIRFDDVDDEPKEEETSELPDHLQAALHRSRDDHEFYAKHGVRFQRCGGGRRCLRHKGGS